MGWNCREHTASALCDMFLTRSKPQSGWLSVEEHALRDNRLSDLQLNG